MTLEAVTDHAGIGSTLGKKGSVARRPVHGAVNSAGCSAWHVKTRPRGSQVPRGRAAAHSAAKTPRPSMFLTVAAAAAAVVRVPRWKSGLMHEPLQTVPGGRHRKRRRTRKKSRRCHPIAVAWGCSRRHVSRLRRSSMPDSRLSPKATESGVGNSPQPAYNCRVPRSAAGRRPRGLPELANNRAHRPRRMAAGSWLTAIPQEPASMLAPQAMQPALCRAPRQPRQMRTETRSRRASRPGSVTTLSLPVPSPGEPRCSNTCGPTLREKPWVPKTN